MQQGQQKLHLSEPNPGDLEKLAEPVQERQVVETRTEYRLADRKQESADT